MAKRKLPKVNMYDAELMLERYVEEFKNDGVTKKPIARALYYVWKWADFNEREVNADECKTES